MKYEFLWIYTTFTLFRDPGSYRWRELNVIKLRFYPLA